MRRTSLPLSVLVAVFVCLICATPGHAQATRTWVSGVGDDANPCSRTAPCKTFAGAMPKTATGGVINCLDPGGFGGVTITKAITIDCHQTIGSVLVGGTNGITINAPGAIVNLRGVDVQGVGTGLIGISILAAATVNLEDIVVNQFTQQGISDTRPSATAATELSVRNSTIENNTGAGIYLAGGLNVASIENVYSGNNGYGVQAETNNYVLVSRSVVFGNTTAGIQADTGASVFVNNTESMHNSTGVVAAGTGSVSLANSDILVNNPSGISGATTSYGNNRVQYNASPGTTPTLGTITNDHSQE